MHLFEFEYVQEHVDVDVDGLVDVLVRELSVQWRAHELSRGVDIEVWITAMDVWHRDVLCSGGDDARLHGWDVRCE